MNILLINVCIRYDSPIKHIPVGLSCIATALNNAGFKPDILDIDLYRLSEEQVEEFLNGKQYDIVGLGNIVSGYKYTKKLCRIIKRIIPDTILIVGNTVATSIPELLLTRVTEVDIAIIGEGDETIVELVNIIRRRRNWRNVPGIAYRDVERLFFTPKRKPIPKMENIPFPDYSLFEIEKYLEISNISVPEPYPLPLEDLRALPVNTARGCPFNCTFCGHVLKNISIVIILLI